MTTKAKKKEKLIPALPFLEKLTASPLTFPQLIKSLRLCEEMSLSEFSSILGISRSHLCDIEKGRKAVSLERAVTFAEILGYSTHQFAKLALQTQVDKVGLSFKVSLEAA